jgi:soluble lytic murein transglycosylase
MAYLQDEYDTAIEVWSYLMDTYPTSQLFSFAGYWRARALLNLGRDDEAQQVFAELVDGSVDYYRLRAEDQLTGQLPHTVPLTVPANTQLAQERAQAELWLRDWLKLDEDVTNLSGLSDEILANLHFQRGRDLLAFGLRDKALVEFEQVKDDFWDDPLSMYRLANYFHQERLGQLGILVAGRVIFLSPTNHTFEAPLYMQRLFYPFYYSDLIFAEAEAQDIDPALIVSLIRQESLFEADAESWVGARGLMQVMPGTGDYVAERSEFGPFNTDQLWLPWVSVKFGAWYIDQQLGIFDDNQFAAMAAYNAGPGNVLDWIETSDDLDIFVEAIPYWESRTYIRRVYENLSAYRRIYGPSPQQD